MSTLYTRRGDTGTSGLYGTRVRRIKSAQIYEALGSIDELNAWIGLVQSSVSYDRLVHPILHEMQETLFTGQAELAGAAPRVTDLHLKRLESMLESVEAQIENPHGFVLPGATQDAALLDVARTVARRAERAVVRLRRRSLRPLIGFLNRTSSALYTLARYISHVAHAVEEHPQYRA